jgi:hypothetical protein
MNIGVKGLVVILLDPIAYWNCGEIPLSEKCIMSMTQRRFPKRP